VLFVSRILGISVKDRVWYIATFVELLLQKRHSYSDESIEGPT
jgi:hypothetical protein